MHQVEMNRRTEDRIDMQLPCWLQFPAVWSGSRDGFTANLHRSGVMVECRIKPGQQLPALGANASVHIELPPSPLFPPKFMRCDTTLLRIDELGDLQFQFAMQIRKVDFGDLSPAAKKMLELDPEGCAYKM